MASLIKKIYELLTKSQKRSVAKLQLLVIFMAFSEIISVMAIGPFMALVGNEKLLQTNPVIASLYKSSSFGSSYDFLFFIGLSVLALMAFGSIISVISVWKMSQFSNQIGAEIGDRLYKYYIYKPWLFHSMGSSAQLTKQISTEVHRVTSQILNPIMIMNAKIVLVSFILCLLFVFNPKVALVTLCIFLIAYVLLYKTIRSRLKVYGETVSSSNALRFKLMADAFGGIKDVLLLGRQEEFIKKFSASGKKLAQAMGANLALAQSPRYLMEFIAFSAVIVFILFLIKYYHGDMGKILPVLAMYSLAGFKLLPAFQQIYSSVVSIKANLPAFESIYKDLADSKEINYSAQSKDSSVLAPIAKVSLQNVTFSYPGKTKPAVENLSIDIRINTTVGIVGASGAGKSTVIDLLLGLIEPQSGQLRIDEVVIDNKNVRAWQNAVGFVPQSIFLSDDSIKENIAFGLAEAQIDDEKIKRIINTSHLDELVAELPDGVDTKIGDRGVQLSGGQKQRIGIARCLYQESSFLIFDEATSALDGLTEKNIMHAIYEFSGKKTIVIIAHRLQTVQKCDVIYFMDQGKVIDVGTYAYLLNNNPKFSALAKI